MWICIKGDCGIRSEDERSFIPKQRQKMMIIYLKLEEINVRTYLPSGGFGREEERENFKKKGKSGGYFLGSSQWPNAMKWAAYFHLWNQQELVRRVGLIFPRTESCIQRGERASMVTNMSAIFVILFFVMWWEKNLLIVFCNLYKLGKDKIRQFCCTEKNKCKWFSVSMSLFFVFFIRGHWVHVPFVISSHERLENSVYFEKDIPLVGEIPSWCFYSQNYNLSAVASLFTDSRTMIR